MLALFLSEPFLVHLTLRPMYFLPYSPWFPPICPPRVFDGKVRLATSSVMAASKIIWGRSLALHVFLSKSYCLATVEATKSSSEDFPELFLPIIRLTRRMVSKPVSSSKHL